MTTASATGKSTQVYRPQPTPVQDPKKDSFLHRLAHKNQDAVAHKETVDGYFSFWDGDRKKGEGDFKDTTEGVAKRRGGSAVLTNHFYDLVTDFYEYGWGTSFHFAPMYKDSSFATSIARHEDYLALKLGIGAGDRVLDVGCGVGGPLREIARFSGANIVGLNNNAYQVKRCDYLAEKFGMSDLCSAVKGNFDDMPFPANSFDAVFSIEATCHSSALEKPYAEIFRVLKPGGKFACYEWLTTPKYEENDLFHKKIIHNLEEGNSLPKLYTFETCLAAAKSVGFEVVEYYDLADMKHREVKGRAPAQEPWHTPLKGSYALSLDNISRWKMTPIGRMITDTFVWVLETIGLAPPGTRKISQVLNLGADALVKAGDLELFTPMFYIMVRKPLSVGAVEGMEMSGTSSTLDAAVSA